MRKAQKVYLCIMLSLFVIFLVLFTIHEIQYIAENLEYVDRLRSEAEINPDLFYKLEIPSAQFENVWHFCFIYLAVIVAVLSLIKNGYTLLAKDQPKSKRISCIISSFLVLALITALILYAPYQLSAPGYFLVILLIWPIIITSFILGCIHIKIGKNKSSS